MRKKCGKRRKKRAAFLLSGLVLILAAGLVAFLRLYKPDLVRETVTVEAGTPAAEAAAFLREEGEGQEIRYLSDVSAIDCTIPGSYPVELQVGRYHYHSLLEVVDTVPPEGSSRDVAGWVGDIFWPEAFLESASDISGVTVSFRREPDRSQPGIQTVELLLTDGAGNQTVLTARLTLQTDGEAPVITGALDQTVTAGDSISYRAGVTAADNRDGEVEVQVDASQVDLDTPGVYTVVYTAEDQAGNRAWETALVTVEPEDTAEELRPEMEELAREAVEECDLDGMSSRNQLYTMFWYVKNHMNYTGTSDKTSQIHEAIQGFTEGQGDCFTYFSMLKAMMEAAGFETRDVTRQGGETRHFWSLVLVDGEWYHIDSCPRNDAHNPSWYCFLRTDAELEEFSQQYGGYYNFDHTGLPQTP